MTNETCQICGTPLPPGYLRYCDDCVSHFTDEERQRREHFGKISSFEEMRRRPAMSYTALLLLVVALPSVVYLFVAAAMFGSGRNMLENALSFLIALNLLVAVLAWGWLWAAAFGDDLMWAVASLILPPLAYRYAQLRWDRFSVRATFITHAAALIAAAALTVLLARLRHIGVFQVLGEVRNFAAMR